MRRRRRTISPRPPGEAHRTGDILGALPCAPLVSIAHHERLDRVGTGVATVARVPPLHHRDAAQLGGQPFGFLHSSRQSAVVANHKLGITANYRASMKNRCHTRPLLWGCDLSTAEPA